MGNMADRCVAKEGATKYVDLQEVTETEYLSKDLRKNWSRVWTTRAFNPENAFYETTAYTAAKKHLWYTGWVTLCGYPGDGKTCTAEHLVCNFVRGPWQYPIKKDGGWGSGEPKTDAWERKKYYLNSISETDRPRYTPVYINSPEEYFSKLNQKEHQIFVIDDIFGVACLNLSQMELWRPHLEDILMDVTVNRPQRLVILCVNKAHLEQVPDEILQLEWFKKGIMIDFTSTHAPDKMDQKQLIIKNALSGCTSMDQRAMEEAGFFKVKESAGLVYRIYSQVSSFKMEGAGFFHDPWRHVQEAIDKIYRFDKIFYYTIGVATLLDGNLDLSKQSLTDYDARMQSIFQELIPLLQIPEHVNLSMMRYAAKQLTGFFFYPMDQWKWTFTHPKIYQLCLKALYSRCTKELVRLVSADLIFSYIQTTNFRENKHEMPVRIARESFDILARRFIYEMLSGKMKQVIQSSCFRDVNFVKVWFEQIAEISSFENIFLLNDPVLKRSTFYWACFYGQGYIVGHVLQSKEVNFQGEDWFRQEMRLGLYAACASSSPIAEYAVKSLLDQGVDLSVWEVYEENTHGKVFGQDLCYLMFTEASMIHIAAKLGHPETLWQLIVQGASYSDESRDGYTPLHRAASRLDHAGETIIEYLTRQGADVNKKTATGKLPIHEAVRVGNKRAVSALVYAGANIKGKMEDGRSFLIPAIQGRQTELVDYLLMCGAIPNGSYEEYFTPVQHAAKIGDVDLVERLIKKGAMVNKFGRAGMTPLHLAVLYGDEGMVDKLLAHGGDVNSQTVKNVTPLHIAAKHGLYNICDKLLSVSNAKPELMTSSGKTALVLAAEGNHQMVVWLLLKEGMELEGGRREIGGPFMGRDFFRMFKY